MRENLDKRMSASTNVGTMKVVRNGHIGGIFLSSSCQAVLKNYF